MLLGYDRSWKTIMSDYVTAQGNLKTNMLASRPEKSYQAKSKAQSATQLYAVRDFLLMNLYYYFIIWNVSGSHKN